jgi:hypothetical protein
MLIYHTQMDTFAEKANVDYRNFLPAKENKLFFFIVCFAANKRKLLLSINSVYCTYIYILYILKQQHIYIDMDI